MYGFVWANLSDVRELEKEASSIFSLSKLMMEGWKWLWVQDEIGSLLEILECKRETEREGKRDAPSPSCLPPSRTSAGGPLWMKIFSNSKCSQSVGTHFGFLGHFCSFSLTGYIEGKAD